MFECCTDEMILSYCSKKVLGILRTCMEHAADIFPSVLRRLQKEERHFRAHWIELWHAAEEHPEALDTFDTSVASTCVVALAARFNALPSRDSLRAPAPFDRWAEVFVPPSLRPISTTLLNSRDEILAHLLAARGLLQLCDEVYVPALRRGTSSAGSFSMCHEYAELKMLLRQSMYTVENGLLPALVEMLQCSGVWCGLSDDRDSAVCVERNRKSEEHLEKCLSLVELPQVDAEEEDALRKAELTKIAQDLHELRELQSYASTLVEEHGALLQQSSAGIDNALDNAVASRLQLTRAAKYKIAGATLTGALIGGLLGGPVGLLAGAKSAASVGLVALAGGATGGVVGNAVVSGAVARATAVDESSVHVAS